MHRYCTHRSLPQHRTDELLPRDSPLFTGAVPLTPPPSSPLPPGKCSALIKVTGDLGELLLGHSTHDSFTAMTRVYKHFDYGGLADGAVVARRVAFSSYPGACAGGKEG